MVKNFSLDDIPCPRACPCPCPKILVLKLSGFLIERLGPGRVSPVGPVGRGPVKKLRKFICDIIGKFGHRHGHGKT